MHYYLCGRYHYKPHFIYTRKLDKDVLSQYFPWSTLLPQNRVSNKVQGDLISRSVLLITMIFCLSFMYFLYQILRIQIVFSLECKLLEILELSWMCSQCNSQYNEVSRHYEQKRKGRGQRNCSKRHFMTLASYRSPGICIA